MEALWPRREWAVLSEGAVKPSEMVSPHRSLHKIAHYTAGQALFLGCHEFRQKAFHKTGAVSGSIIIQIMTESE